MPHASPGRDRRLDELASPLAGIKRKVKDVGLRIRNVKAKTKGSDHTVKQASLVSRAAGTEHADVASTFLQRGGVPDDHLEAAMQRVTESEPNAAT